MTINRSEHRIAKEAGLTQDSLKASLAYDPDSGDFRWKRKGGGRVKPGDIAGVLGAGGYRLIRMGGVLWMAHRLAFLYVRGSWPKEDVDHKDCNPANNRWGNLRECRPSENGGNARISKRNKSGTKGVWWDKQRGKWIAAIRVNGRRLRLGYFAEIDDAARAYRVGAEKHFGEFARTA